MLLMAAGVFCVMTLFVPPFGTKGVFVLLCVLLALTVLLRRYSRLSTLCILSASFVLGVFLALESIERNYEPLFSLPVADRVEESLSFHREKMLHIYEEVGLSDEVRSVVSAMTLGERQDISQSLKQAYRVTGAAHVFAMSGLHISIIFMFITMLLPTRFFPVASAAMQMLLLWTFVFLVGLHPSILRAAVMFTCYSLCRLLSRSTRSIDILILAATLLIIYNPQWLFDIGFQMSFMAMVGILLLCKRIQSILPYRFLRYPWGIVAVTISATLGTAPLIAHYFGRLSCYGLLANLIVSPCALLILFLAFLLLLLAYLQPYLTILSSLTSLVATLLDGVVRFMNASILWLSALPGASIEGIDITFAQTILIYILIACTLLVIYHLKHGIVLRSSKL